MQKIKCSENAISFVEPCQNVFQKLAGLKGSSEAANQAAYYGVRGIASASITFRLCSLPLSHCV